MLIWENKAKLHDKMSKKIHEECAQESSQQSNLEKTLKDKRWSGIIGREWGEDVETGSLVGLIAEKAPTTGELAHQQDQDKRKTIPFKGSIL